MIETLVITLREGIEAALVVGIVIAFLNKMGKFELKKYAYFGLIPATIFSILGAVIFNLIGFDPENEILEGSMFFISAIFVTSMVIWMQKTSKNIKKGMEEKLHSIVNSNDNSEYKKQCIAILLFTFFMVFREGIETVLFLSALASKNNAFANFSGGFIGILLAILFAVFFIRGSLRINLSKFFTVTGWVLMILVLRLVAGGVHEFGEVGILPINSDIMKVIGLIVRDNSTMIISMMLLSLPIVLVLLDIKSAKQLKDQAINREQIKTAGTKNDRIWKVAVVSSALIINLILGVTLVAQATKPVYDSEIKTVSADSDVISVPLDSLKHDVISKFEYTVDGVNIRFFLIAASEGAVKSALDACKICGTKGYLQKQNNKNNIICKNCNAPIEISNIGVHQGCNPIPLQSEVKNNQVIIKVKDLINVKNIFIN